MKSSDGSSAKSDFPEVKSSDEIVELLSKMGLSVSSFFSVNGTEYIVIRSEDGSYSVISKNKSVRN